MVMYDFEESYAGDGAACGYGRSVDSIRLLSGNSYCNSNNINSNSCWAQMAESTMPLKPSKFAAANQGQFQESVELRSKQLSNRVILINLISLLVNLILAVIAFYFSFANNSSATSAFAADCVLDFISSAILLWRYFGDLNSVYMHAREQIACIYLGALFELSGLAIVIKAISDMSSGADPFSDNEEATYELLYLAIAATVACIVLTLFKCALYKTLRDNSILLDVINTLVSTVFAMSIVMSQALINVNRSFWYLDPILSIILALFMMGFGIKVIHQNFNILRPIYGGGGGGGRGSNNQANALIEQSYSSESFGQFLHFGKKAGAERTTPIANDNNNNNNYNQDFTIDRSGSYISNLRLSQRPVNWQKTDYSTITFN